MKHTRTAIIAALLLLATVTFMLRAAPQFTNATLLNGNLILKGSGGISRGPFNLLATTNLALPRFQWTVAATNIFDGNGLFNLTNAVDASKGQQFYALQGPPASNDLWIPAWGAWLGAEVTNGTTQDFTDEETRIGRSLDILRIYHGVGDWTKLTSQETTYINAGRKLLVSFKPNSSWANAGGGDATVNAQLQTLAQSIAGVAPSKLMVCVWHEPDNDVITNGGSAGTTAQYVSMWTNVEHIFRANGATNVIWIWITENYSKFWGSLPELWPGNTNVDWIGWDLYQGSASQDYVAAQATAYNHIVTTSNPTNDYLSKPWAWTEWGVGINGYTPTVAVQTNTFNAVNAALNNYQFPKIKYLAYFDVSGSSAHNASSAIFPGAQPAYNALANSTYLFQQEPPQSIPVGVIYNSSNELEVFAVNSSDGSVDHIAQPSPNGGWGSWTSLGGSGATKVVACFDTNNNTGAFSLEGTNAYYAYRLNGGTSWSSWASLGTNGVSDIAIATNFNGGLELFANGMDGNLYHTWESVAGNITTWHAWKNIGYSGASDGIVVGHELNLASHVFCIGSNNAVYHAYEYSGGAWTNPVSLGQSAADLCVYAWPAGNLSLFIAQTDGTVYENDETAANSTASWSGWHAPLMSTVAAERIAVTDNGGSPALFFIGADHNIYLALYNGGWPSSPMDLSSQSSGVGQVSANNLVVGAGQNGGLQVFIIAPDGLLYHDYQGSGAGGSWNGFTSLGGNEL